MTNFKSLVAAAGFALAAMLPGAASAVSLSDVTIAASPAINGSNFTVNIALGAFDNFVGAPQVFSATGVVIPTALSALTFNTGSDTFFFAAFPPAPGTFPLSATTLEDSSVSGSTVDLLFSGIGGSLAGDFGNLVVLRFTGTADFANGSNSGASVSILSATPIPVPLGIVTLSSGLGLLAFGRMRRKTLG